MGGFYGGNKYEMQDLGDDDDMNDYDQEYYAEDSDNEEP